MKRIRTTKQEPNKPKKKPSLLQADAKRMFITHEAMKALMRAIDNVCDPDGWTTVGTELHQLWYYYDDTDDIPRWAYNEALEKVEHGQIKPADLDGRLCDKCSRGKHSDLHEEECLNPAEDG
jgi:hypothetical protein